MSTRIMLEMCLCPQANVQYTVAACWPAPFPAAQIKVPSGTHTTQCAYPQHALYCQHVCQGNKLKMHGCKNNLLFASALALPARQSREPFQSTLASGEHQGLQLQIGSPRYLLLLLCEVCNSSSCIRNRSC